MNLALFFTNGTSLKLWHDRGWLHSGVGIQSYNRWADSFEKLYFVTYGDKKDLEYGHFLRDNIVVLPKKYKIPACLYGLFVPFIYRNELKNVDVFFSAQMEGAWAALVAKILFKGKFVLRCGFQWFLADFGGGFGYVKKIMAYFIELVTYKVADFIILTSQQAKEHVIKKYNISASKIEVIRNPVDIDLFKPMNIDKKPNSIVYVGRLGKEKNLFELLGAVKETNKNLTLFGDGYLKEELQKYVNDNNINAIFRGNINNNKLPEELNKNSVFILTSIYENSPKALLEAMGCGMAVIGTDVMGINELIDHKENGYLCGTDKESIKNAIVEVFSNEELRKKMGDNARKYILENCDLNKKIKREIEIFKSI